MIVPQTGEIFPDNFQIIMGKVGLRAPDTQDTTISLLDGLIILEPKLTIINGLELKMIEIRHRLMRQLALTPDVVYSHRQLTHLPWSQEVATSRLMHKTILDTHIYLNKKGIDQKIFSLVRNRGYFISSSIVDDIKY